MNMKIRPEYKAQWLRAAELHDETLTAWVCKHLNAAAKRDLRAQG
jgi:hypothetical protein